MKDSSSCGEGKGREGTRREGYPGVSVRDTVYGVERWLVWETCGKIGALRR